MESHRFEREGQLIAVGKAVKLLKALARRFR